MRLGVLILAVLAATPAAAQRPGQIAPAPAPAPVQQVPGYITAKPDAVVRAFGQGVASKIFSDAYTNVREQAILRSQKSVPGFQCPGTSNTGHLLAPLNDSGREGSPGYCASNT